MGRLLKLQLFRAVKDKGTIVFAIVTLALGVLSTLFSYVIMENSGGMGGMMDEMFATTTLVNSTFSLTSTPLLLLIIMGVVLLYKESGWGTIRNQVVAGYSKYRIYFANFFAMLIVTFTILVAYQLVVFGFGSILGFGSGVSNSADFWNFARIYGLNLLVFIAEIAFMTFISMLFQNIIAPVFLVIILPVFVSTILMTLIPVFVLFSEDGTLIVAGFEYIIWYQNTALTISGFSYELINSLGSLLDIKVYDTESVAFVLKTIITNVGLSAIFLGLGSYLFARKDLK